MVMYEIHAKVNFTKYVVQFDAITMVLSYKHDER